MLSINTDLTAVAPTNFSCAWRQRIDYCSEERCLSLAVVAHDGRPPPVIDFQADIGGDFALRVSDRQTSAAESGAFTRFDERCANGGRRLVVGDFHSLQTLQLFALAAGARGGAGAGFIL